MSFKIMPNKYRRNRLIKNEVNEELLSQVRDLLQEELSIKDYLMRGGHTHNDNSKICCPIHIENTPSFFYDDEMGVFNCFGCGRGGTISELHMHLMQVENPSTSYLQSVIDLSKMYSIKIPDLFESNHEDIVKKEEVKLIRFPSQLSVEERERMYSNKYLKTMLRYNTLFKRADAETRFEVACVIDNYYLGLISPKDVIKEVELIKQSYNQKLYVANQTQSPK